MTKGDWKPYQKCPFRYKHERTLCGHCEDKPDPDPLNTRGRLALKAASLNTHVFYLDQPSPGMFYFQRLEENQVPHGQLQPLFLTVSILYTESL